MSERKSKKSTKTTGSPKKTSRASVVSVAKHLQKENLNEKMDCLAIGMTIDIKRSDGRVHSAVISALRPGDQMVDVEWFELGETKGKAVDVSSVFRTNPKLTGEDASKTQPVVHTNKIQPVYDEPAKSPMKPVVQPAVNGYRKSVIGDVDAKAVQTQQTSRKINTATARARQSMVQLPTPSPVEERKVLNADIQNIDKAVVSPHIVSLQKASVVLKNEELERGRLERRQTQADERKQREAFKNLDPGNPNWEFLRMIREYRSGIDFRPLKMSDPVVDNRICVCVRKRPLSKKEMNQKEFEIVSIPTRDQIIVHQPQTKVDLTKYLDNQKFRFDYAFDDSADNDMVYRFTAQPLIKTIFQGGFATCFAYGQTGSGKTHTMGGDFEGKNQDCSKGIYALAAVDVFNTLRKAEYKSAGLSVCCSFFELYGSKAFDLLGKKGALRIMEDKRKNVQIVGLIERKVNSSDDVLKLIREGTINRTSGQTSANANSSRSHAIFQITLKKGESVHGKFSLIDLAGNERGADTRSSDAQTRSEGAAINKALLTLKECIRAMAMMKSYLPFRGDKLTLVLRDSFIGKNAKTCMIATISPGISSAENTLNTLRYAHRAKELDGDGVEDLDQLDYLPEEDEEIEEEHSPEEEEIVLEDDEPEIAGNFKVIVQISKDGKIVENDELRHLIAKKSPFLKIVERELCN